HLDVSGALEELSNLSTVNVEGKVTDEKLEIRREGLGEERRHQRRCCLLRLRSLTATLRTKRDAAAEMEMEEEIEWRLKEMEGGRREAETGLEMVKKGNTEKTRKERKKLQM
ncbi:LOW QUALITY PROTEIN: hypothetical protein HID58_081139, partial [Brassica napus]